MEWVLHLNMENLCKLLVALAQVETSGALFLENLELRVDVCNSFRVLGFCCSICRIRIYFVDVRVGAYTKLCRDH